jgi:hypothetical protein
MRPALLPLLAATTAAGLACSAAPKKVPDPPVGVRKELVGSWTCPDAWLIERSGGKGPNTLRLKEDGVSVLTARPTGSKHYFRVYGRWGADGKKLYQDTRWYQKDAGKLQPLGRPGDYGDGAEYALAPDGSELTLGTLTYKRDAAPGEAGR